MADAQLETALDELRLEIQRSRAKHPGRAHKLAALTEEVGELAQVYLQGQGRARVRAEAIQVACVAIRIAIEGDSEFEPDEVRDAG
jgi:NTP pyrophosphatase (non-canonical NTP hydrolase)